MQWLIQNSGMTFDALDHNLEPLVAALDELQVSKHAIGFVPDTQTITGLENIDHTIPTMFYDPVWFDPAVIAEHRDDMLNQINKKITVGEFRHSWTREPVFVKSTEPKALTGMVLENMDRDWWLEEYSHLTDDVELNLSPVHKIEKEWRFFIVKGEIVAGSQYKELGVLRIKPPVPENIHNRAFLMSEKWLPSENIVMDICQLSTGEKKVVEVNCLNSSGFYNCNVKNIVEALNK